GPGSICAGGGGPTPWTAPLHGPSRASVCWCMVGPPIPARPLCRAHLSVVLLPGPIRHVNVILLPSFTFCSVPEHPPFRLDVMHLAAGRRVPHRIPRPGDQPGRPKGVFRSGILCCRAGASCLDTP